MTKTVFRQQRIATEKPLLKASHSILNKGTFENPSSQGREALDPEIGCYLLIG
jgi:hypothetical protein